MTDLEPQYQQYCNGCWVTFPYKQLVAIGSQMYCKECEPAMANKPRYDSYEEKPDRGAAHGIRMAGHDNVEEEVQQIIRDNPEDTPKGENVVKAGVPIGSDVNSGRNDSGRGAVPPGTPSLATPAEGARAKASASQTLPTDSDEASAKLKSKATRNTVAGNNNP
jgi:hypothetical protein